MSDKRWGDERIRDLNEDLQPRNETPALSPCPCGEAAVWYRADIPANLTVSSGKAISAMTARDFHENLCNECFEAAIDPAARANWAHVPV